MVKKRKKGGAGQPEEEGGEKWQQTQAAEEVQASKKRKDHEPVASAAKQEVNTNKPSAMDMLRPKAGRHYTVSVALPASIIDNAPGGELKALLVGQIARAFTIFSVDEVVLWEDNSAAVTESMDGGEEDDKVSNAMGFFVRNLQYLETPQYLRKSLLPMHKDLKWAGLLSPLDAPHHLRKDERLPYREAVTLSAEQAWHPSPKAENGVEEAGCWANCGLAQPVWVPGDVPAGVRVTLRLGKRVTNTASAAAEETDWNSTLPESYLTASAVAPSEPTTKMGLYWGFQVRIAKTMRAVFEECPHEGGYDLKVGTSERGERLGNKKLSKFRHLLIVFGGVGGLEEALQDEGSGYPGGTAASTLFDRYLNIVPHQTSRTIRTEEAVLITLTSLSSHFPGR